MAQVIRGRDAQLATGSMTTARNGARNGALRSRGAALALALALGTAAVGLPGAALAQSYSFNAVSVEGNQRIETGTILSYAGIARGQTVSAAQLNDAYQRILASGLFESVEIEPRGGTLAIKVVEFPTINRIAFEGNRRIKDEDLSPIVQSQSRRVFSPRLAEADAQLISEAYVQQGRIAARVQPKVIRRSDNRVDLVFEIFEGGVAEIERIGFVGNGTYSDNRLRRVLDTKQAGLLRAVIRKDTFIEDRIEFDKQLLRDFYAARGYVDFRVTGVNAELSAERDGYFVTFNLEEGQQFNVGAVSVTSDLPEVDSELFQSKLRLREGLVYSPSLVELEITRLERLALNEGLNFVRVEPRITRNDRDLTLDVEFLLTRGERIFVERIDIEGNTTTMDQVVRRQFTVVEGDPFNPRAIRESAERIRALGFFSSADVQAREGSSPQQVIVDVDVEEQPTGSLSFGGSYSTDGGFGAAISFSERNFLGRGQSLSLSINTSSSAGDYAFSFVEPAFLGRQGVAFGVALSYNETTEFNNAFNTTSGTFRPFLSFPLTERTSAQLRYTLNGTEISIPGGSTVGALINAEAAQGQQVASSVGYTLTYDSRRAGLNPNTALLLEFGQDLAGLGGDSSYIKSDFRGIAQTKILNEEVTLRATVEAGALSFSQGASRVTDRYSVGPSKLRGFESGGIGPREISAGVNDALGGNYYAVARFDAEFPLGLPEEYGIRGGLFYDMGSVWGLDATNANVVSEAFSLRQAVGFSILWDSAIGPLRLNFSEAVGKQSSDRVQNFNLSISTNF